MIWSYNKINGVKSIRPYAVIQPFWCVIVRILAGNTPVETSYAQCYDDSATNKLYGLTFELLCKTCRLDWTDFNSKNINLATYILRQK